MKCAWWRVGSRLVVCQSRLVRARGPTMDKARLNCQRQRDPAWAQTRVDCRSGSRRGELGYVSTWKQVLLTRNGGQGRDRGRALGCLVRRKAEGSSSVQVRARHGHGCRRQGDVRERRRCCCDTKGTETIVQCGAAHDHVLQREREREQDSERQRLKGSLVWPGLWEAGWRGEKQMGDTETANPWRPTNGRTVHWRRGTQSS